MPENEIKINVVDWQQEKTPLREIRRKVFIEEQHVPEELEWDEDDASASHFLVTLDGKPVATARLSPTGKIGRMAVLYHYRNRGIGSKLLAEVLRHASQLNLQDLYLYAQVDAIAFYERQGFTSRGKIFYEANIPHREMFKKLC